MSRSYTVTNKALRQRAAAAKLPRKGDEKVVYLTVRLRQEAAFRVRSASRAAGITCSDIIMRHIPEVF